MRIYLDFILRDQLLYEGEREQYQQAVADGTIKDILPPLVPIYLLFNNPYHTSKIFFVTKYLDNQYSNIVEKNPNRCDFSVLLEQNVTQ